MPDIPRPRATADSRTRAPGGDPADEAAQERREEIRLHRELAGIERAPVAVSPETDAMLRERLCHGPPP